jgi:heme/copper-type cytochrome/quinol oxidase subunit 2
LKSEKLPRSFAVDVYRLSKRVAGGSSITFEFHANQPGTFTFYCNLTSVKACRDMKGTLVVNPK